MKIAESSEKSGIKQDFPFINICKVPREMLKTEGEFSSYRTDTTET